MEQEKKDSQNKTSEFVKKHWPTLVVAGTVVGATVWLVARFIKQKRNSNSSEYIALSELENEALSTTDETSILLETGTHLTKIAGNEIKEVTEELSQHITDEKGKSALDVLNGMVKNQSKKQRGG